MTFFQPHLSPPYAVGTLLNAVFSLAKFYFPHAPRPSLPDRRSLDDFDINLHTGFFPPTPLSRLPPSFDLWEDSLSAAAGSLCLGDDDSSEAKSKREFGKAWRDDIDLVSIFLISGLCRSSLPVSQVANALSK